MIVEYCCHGNLQQFLLARRRSFTNQVNPLTGIYDSNYRSLVGGGCGGDSVSRRTSNSAYNSYVNRCKRLCPNVQYIVNVTRSPL